MIDIKDKVILITGASRGIGRAITLKLASQQMRVVVNYYHNKENADKVVDAIVAKKGSAIAIQADVGNNEDVERMIAEIIEHFGQLDFLVNNAGVTRDAFFQKMDEDMWQEVLQINLTGAFYCSKAALPHLSEGSAIVNISSVVGQMGNIGQTNYAAAKAGLIGFSKSLAKELSRKKIRVNAVAPGLINTDMTKTIPQKALDSILKMIPLGTIGEPEDIAETVLFLLQNAYITGEVVKVNGGLHM